jgi:4-hydroxy-4-methyl-2-oxoglutarate aldolase
VTPGPLAARGRDGAEVPQSESMTPSSERSAIRARFEGIPTAVVCDVYDEEGWEPRALCAELRPVTALGTPLAGFASTIVGRQERFAGADHAKLAAVDALEPDSVAVWAGTDAGQYCLFGDLIAAAMQHRGCRGAVVDGGLRDSRAIDAAGFPVYARLLSPVQGLGRWRVADVDVPVTILAAYGPPVMVRPGDFVLGDADGVVIIEAERIDGVLRRAEAIVAAEAEARRSSGEGMSAQEMLERFGHV